MAESSAATTNAADATVTTTVLVGVDHSEHSYYALERAVSFVAANTPRTGRVVAVHARRPPSSAFLGLDAMARVRRVEDTDQRSMDVLIQQKAGELSAKYGVEVPVELVDGEPKRVLCGAVERLHAGVLVVGSHGYGPIMRALAGSVSDYCCHHARCPVMVVKMPRA